MDIKTSIFERAAREKLTKQIGEDGQPKKVKVRGGWIYRLRYTDQNGKPCTRERGFFKLKSQAKDAMNAAVEELKQTGGQKVSGEKMTFNELVAICEDQFYKPAVLINGRKKEGVRSIGPVKSSLKQLKAYFGTRRIRNITEQSLRDYQSLRMNPTKPDVDAVSITTVNREMQIFRRMWRHAMKERFVFNDLFFKTDVIQTSLESERTRILNRDEEARLLAACEGEREVTYTRKVRGIKREVTARVSCEQPHLRAMIIIAIDSGLRRRELLSLKWDDINFQEGYISVISTNTKTERPRLAPLSERGKMELERMRTLHNADGPFPYSDVKTAFHTATRLAKIDDLMFRDLRRTAITRWQEQGTALAFAGKAAGHTQLKTTMKYYTALDESMVQQISERINAEHSTEKELDSDFVN